MVVKEKTESQHLEPTLRTRLAWTPSIPHFSREDLFEGSTAIFAMVIVLIIAVASFLLVRGSIPVLQRFGTGFFSGSNWIPAAPGESVPNETYNILPYVLGTLVTSAIAVAIGVPLSLGIAIFLAEMAPLSVRNSLSRVIELLAAVPSIIYGFWGLIVFRFWVADYVEKPVSNYFGTVPVFKGPLLGLDILTASLILAIMIIPTIASISKDVMTAVPSSQREAAYSIGATRWEVIRIGVLGYARSGIFGAVILGLGRAVGETMAVTMIIANATGAQAIPTSLFQAGATMASVIANEYPEAAVGTLHLSALLGIALTLMLFALVINVFAQLMVWKILKIRGGSIE